MKPILLSTDMVRAILDGRKTVTRRVIKPQPISRLSYVCMGHKCGSWSYPGADAWKYWEDESFRLPEGLTDEDKNRHWTPPCHTDDILYVRETFCPYEKGHVIDGKKYAYKADATVFSEERRKEFGYKWHPSIHMPREAARIFLRIKKVRVEPLWDMRLKDCLEEGVILTSSEIDDCIKAPIRAQERYSAVWDSTIKPKDRSRYGWAANPWVWVIEFEQISKEEVSSE